MSKGNRKITKFGGRKYYVKMVDCGKTIRYKDPNYIPPERVKKSKAEQRAEKISRYADEHNMPLSKLEYIISRYLDKFPEKVSSAGNENGSNRFINECLKAFEGEKLPDPSVEVSDDLLVFMLLLLLWGENAHRVTIYGREFGLWRIEVIGAIIYYLSLYPEKTLSEGCENLSERFFRACMRNHPKIAQKMISRGIKI